MHPVSLCEKNSVSFFHFQIFVTTMNAIYIRRRSKVMLPDGSGATPITVLAALQKNLEASGSSCQKRSSSVSRH